MHLVSRLKRIREAKELRWRQMNQRHPNQRHPKPTRRAQQHGHFVPDLYRYHHRRERVRHHHQRQLCRLRDLHLRRRLQLTPTPRRERQGIEIEWPSSIVSYLQPRRAKPRQQSPQQFKGHRERERLRTLSEQPTMARTSMDRQREQE